MNIGKENQRETQTAIGTEGKVRREKQKQPETERREIKLE